MCHRGFYIKFILVFFFHLFEFFMNNFRIFPKIAICFRQYFFLDLVLFFNNAVFQYVLLTNTVRWTPKIGQVPKVVLIDKLHGSHEFGVAGNK